MKELKKQECKILLIDDKIKEFKIKAEIEYNSYLTVEGFKKLVGH